LNSLGLLKKIIKQQLKHHQKCLEGKRLDGYSSLW